MTRRAVKAGKVGRVGTPQRRRRILGRKFRMSEDPVVTRLGLGVSDPKSISFSLWSNSKALYNKLSSNDPHLIIVSLFGHEALVGLLLDKGAEVNAQGGRYGNALQAASRGGHKQVVKMLLDKDADVNAQGGEYGNALQAASLRGHEQVVKMLLNKDADVNAQGGYYGNALQAASEGGHEQVVKMLLNAGAHQHQKDD